MAKAKRKRKASKGKNKGSNFERELCKLFSLWWTNRERDDVFWRSQNSGGRATFRARKGQSTFGQYGDMQSTDPCSVPFIRAVNVEFKRGYSHKTVFDLLDRLSHHKEQQFESFIDQAAGDASKAGCFSWLLVVKRDGRCPVVFMPRKLWKVLNSEEGVYLSNCCPLLKLRGRFTHGNRQTVYGMTLNDFFDYLTPKDFKRLDAVWEAERDAGVPMYK